MFIVGRSLGGGINAGVAQLIGRVAIVRWAAIWVDPVSTEIFKPKRIIKTIAHELGHTLGLRDIGRAEALMNPTNGLAGWALSAEECSIAEKGLTLPPFSLSPGP